MSTNSIFKKDFCCLLGANFLLFFSFYLIMPVLPLYLTDLFAVPNSKIGIVLSSYTIAALVIRPFSGYLMDAFSRKPLYLLTYFIYTFIFGGYVIATTLVMFLLFRIMHGLAFGTVTVGGNTLCIDILPTKRRGEGLGYYGLANNLAMSIGPMTGLFLHNSFNYKTLFFCSMIIGLLGFLLAMVMKAPTKPIQEHKAISLDRFLLISGIPAGIALLFLSIPYGITSTYIALFAKECHIEANSGLFFTAMAVGMMGSRIFSGRLVDRGWLTQIISVCVLIVSANCLTLGFLYHLTASNSHTTLLLFIFIAFLQGIAFGGMFPAFNSLFVNLGRNDQRGTATSTYLTSWDVGIGTGVLLGGYISELSSFAITYRICSILCVASFFIFVFWVTPHYNKHKLR